MAFFEHEVPGSARVFVAGVIAAGTAVLLFSLYAALTAPDLTWLFLCVVTVVSGVFPVRLPFRKERGQALTVTVSDVFIFAGLLLYSPEVAVAISFIDGLAASARAYRRRHLYKLLFNFSQLSLSTWLVGYLFYRLMGEIPPLSPSQVDDTFSLLLNLGFCALLHFFLNSGMVALAVGLATGQRVSRVFSENLLWASLTNVAGAAGAAIIFLNFEATPFFAFAVTMPIILVIYYAYKMNLKRINLAQRHLEELDDLYHATITSLAMAIDAKDHSNYGNIQKVRAMTLALAEKMGMRDGDVLKGLRAASLLHDIGKLAIPEYILNKPGKLTEVESAKVRNHPAVGADILETVPFPYPVVSFVRHHHERWDGSGYPDGLRGEAIPLGARIIAVVDCYFGLRSDRPFRPRLSRELALNFIKQESGKAFDPRVAAIFLEHIEDLERAAEEVETHSSPTYAALHDSPPWPQGSERLRIRGTVFHDIASTHKEMQAVYEISQNIGRSLSVKETLVYLSVKIKRFVPYSACSIYLVNSEDDRLLPHQVAGMYRDVLEGVEIRLGDGVTGWVAANNQSLMNVSPELDFPHLEILRSVFKSCLAIPLSVEASVVGVITLYSDAPQNYSDRHLRLMEAIAPHAATAISNAIIYQETQEDAYTDHLTGLPNIRYFNMVVGEELKRAKRIGYPVTLLMMDLDGFKAVNDRYGHKNGDAALIEVGHVLRRQLRKSDTCLRYGGDEFLAILPGLDKSLGSLTSQRIQAAFDGRCLVKIEGEEVGVGISVGVATFPEDGLEPDILVARADRDMYRDKVERAKVTGESAVVPIWRRGERN
jgi:diguanylate cyclase (GGDEF)-like protein/putative nucleotidyltransferase with HDIG domain